MRQECFFSIHHTTTLILLAFTKKKRMGRGQRGMFKTIQFFSINWTNQSHNEDSQQRTDTSPRNVDKPYTIFRFKPFDLFLNSCTINALTVKLNLGYEEFITHTRLHLVAWIQCRRLRSHSHPSYRFWNLPTSYYPSRVIETEKKFLICSISDIGFCVYTRWSFQIIAS